MSRIRETRGITEKGIVPYADGHQEDGGDATNDRPVAIMDSDDEKWSRYIKESVFPMHTFKDSSHRSGSIIHDQSIGKNLWCLRPKRDYVGVNDEFRTHS
jgi:hypothetical protein